MPALQFTLIDTVVVCCVPFALPATVTVYKPAGVPPLVDGVFAPPALPQAPCNRQAPRTAKASSHPSNLLRSCLTIPTVPNSIPGINSANMSMAREPRPVGEESWADALPAGVMVSVALPTSFATDNLPNEQASDGLDAGATLQVKPTPDGLKPFFGLIVMVDVDGWPGVTEAGDAADDESAKSAETAIGLDVLVPKSLSPL